MPERQWEHFEHDADIGLSAFAETRAGLFEAMGEALTALITEPGKVRAEYSVSIGCEAPNDDLLLADWINALVYEMATRKMLFGAWHVRLENHSLDATVAGERVDRERHQPAVEVKGATYTELAVSQDDTGLWRGRCIVDV